MTYNIVTLAAFRKEAKKLIKKYVSLKTELIELETKLQKNPILGTPLGNNCYKIRIAIFSKGKGKTGGARVITYFHIVANTIFLLTIYDKSEQENILNKEIIELLKNIK